MITVLTGDVIGSRKKDPTIWLPVLEEALEVFSVNFDIYRGDSFQAKVNLSDVFVSVFYIKAAMINVGLDVRIGIGVGEEDLPADHIKKTFGTALINSGQAFDELKKDSLALVSGNKDFDELCNVILGLSAELCLRWTANVAGTAKTALLHTGVNQKELANLLGKKHQSQVSNELQKASFFKLKSAINYCTDKLLEL